MAHHWRMAIPVSVIAFLVLATACAPAAPAAPTAASSKPVATSAPAAKPAATTKTAAPTTAPAAKPAATTAPAAKAAATVPAAKPAATVPAAKPAATTAPASKAAATGPSSKAAEEFYQGKTIRVLVGYSAGGPYDIFSRVVAKYLPQYVPGNPTAIVENRPGAASLLVANQVYSSEPKDGTVIGSFSSGSPLLQVLDKPGVEFDARDFNWLGSGSKTVSTCAARLDSGVNTIQDIIGPGAKQLAVGAIGPGTGTHDTPTTLNAVLGANFQVVSGYGGTSNIVLAVEGKEVSGMCANLDTMQSSVSELFEGPNPVQKMIVVMGATTPDHPWLKGVPAAETLATTEAEKQILRAVASSTQMNLPYAVAPEVPAERVEALQKAFAAIFADPQFIAEAERAGFSVDPNTAEELNQVVRNTLNMDPQTVEKLKQILN